MTAITQSKTKLKAIDLAYIALFTVIIAVCSWISIPTAVPFTLQVFGVIISLIVLGGKRGTFAILLYVLLAIIGIPVLAGFGGGLGVLLGTTGGYVLGFILTALVYWLFTKLFGEKIHIQIIAIVLGILLCYTFGTAWFILVYTNLNGSGMGILTALGFCVFPFIIPDIIKTVLAFSLGKVLKKYAKH